MWNHTLAVLIALITVCDVGAQDADPIQKKLDTALLIYDTTVHDAAEQLLKSLTTARDAAQRRGDLDVFQLIVSEIDAFETHSVLPKAVSTTTYQRSNQRAVARVQIAYENAIRDYTRDNKIPLAQQLQAELHAIRESGTVAVDPLRKHREWVSANPQMSFTIMRRDGTSFQARFRIGNNTDRLVKGTADTTSLSWKSTDVVVRAGRGPGGDHAGTIRKDENGYRIEMEWKDGKGNGGKFTLRPARS